MILMRHGESEFNVVYKKTRVDPGIRDPKLTTLGRRQVIKVSKHLQDQNINRILTSPYTRAIETAFIVAKYLGVPIHIDAQIGERAAFACDIGTPGSDLRRAWPKLKLDHIGDSWWPTPVESEETLDMRCRAFRIRQAKISDWRKVLVVSHWGFIRSLTGHTVGNAQLVKFNPHCDHPGGGTVVPMNIPC
ncbi:MAG: histidine phosphatase family protein [Pseudomonadota bacterium]|nr:histidine phosphatase family protein [Pseudomonadota bacterium]